MIICFPWATIGRAPLSIPLAIATVGGGLLIVPPHRDVPVGIAARPAAARAASAAAHARRTVPVVLGSGLWCDDTGYRGWGYGSGIGGPWTSDYGLPLGGFGGFPSFGGGYGYGDAARGPGPVVPAGPALVADGAAPAGGPGAGPDRAADRPGGGLVPDGRAPPDGLPVVDFPGAAVDAVTPVDVPEPAALALVLTGLGAVLAMRRARR